MIHIRAPVYVEQSSGSRDTGEGKHGLMPMLTLGGDLRISSYTIIEEYKIWEHKMKKIIIIVTLLTIVIGALWSTDIQLRGSYIWDGIDLDGHLKEYYFCEDGLLVITNIPADRSSSQVFYETYNINGNVLTHKRHRQVEYDEKDTIVEYRSYEPAQIRQAEIVFMSDGKLLLTYETEDRVFSYRGFIDWEPDSGE